MAQSITIGTVCFLINRNGNKLLLLERSNEPMKNKVTGVGGKTHFGEDIHQSCIREIKEETGYDAKNLKLKGIIKTMLDGHDSSWILFVYTTDNFSGKQIVCPEGELKWISLDKVYHENLIGFIREILPHILTSNSIIEGIIKHDSKGNVLDKHINE